MSTAGWRKSKRRLAPGEPSQRRPGRLAVLAIADAPSGGGLLRAQLFHQRQVIFNMPVGGNFTAADLIDIGGDKIDILSLTLPGAEGPGKAAMKM